MLKTYTAKYKSGMVNLCVEEPYAINWARTDLWEPWEATPRATRP